MKYTCASFFAGVGGIDIGFQNAGMETIYANEIDKYCFQTLNNNFSFRIDNQDIQKIDLNKLPIFDILLAGFPCQAFSVAGYQKGFQDPRGALFFSLLKIIKIKRPSILFLENVKNLINHDNGTTFKFILSSLEMLGYNNHYQVMNSIEYGNIPQNRERLYIVSFLDHSISKKFNFPNKIPLTTDINNIINWDKKVEDYYYYSPKYIIYNQLKDEISQENIIYQWRRKYVRKNKKGFCPTLTANMGTGGHNVPLIKTKYGIRKLTPRECFNLQGFPNSFILPNTISNAQLYKQAGNSVVVPVIYRIATKILECLK